MKQEQLPASILQQPLPQMSTNNTTTLQLPSSIYQRASTHSGSTIITAPTTLMTSTQALPNVTASPQYISSVPIAGTQPTPATQQKLTIQLPTQPQPIAGVKTVTYVSSIGGNTPTQYQTITTSANLTPVKLTTTGFAYTSTGRYFRYRVLKSTINEGNKTFHSAMINENKFCFYRRANCYTGFATRNAIFNWCRRNSR